MQPPYYPPQPYPQQPAPYPYAFPPMPAPEKTYPVPSGRRVPLIWGISLTALVAVAALLALGGGLLRPLAPAPYGHTLYASSLAQDDGAWQLKSDATNQCVFANGSLDATATDAATDSTPSCVLRNQTFSDFRLSVHLAQPTDANNTFWASVFVRNTTSTGVAFFITAQGVIEVFVPQVDSGQTPVLTVSADQWHADSTTDNVLVVQAQADQFTLGMNGVEIYSGDLNGYAGGAGTIGGLALGAVPSLGGNTEARFTDISLTTP